MNVYFISQGEIHQPVNPVSISKVVNWQDECLVVAESEEAALEKAAQYDRGELQQDNVSWQGETIVALS